MGRGCSIALGVVLILVVIAAVVLGRGGGLFGGGDDSGDGGPQYRDKAAVDVVLDSLVTLTEAAGRVKAGILEDILRAMDSQAQYLRNQLGDLPGLDND